MTDTNRNRAALALVSFLAALGIGGAYLLRVPGDPGHLVGGYDPAPDGATPTTCRYNTVRGPSEVWDKLGLDRLDGGTGLAAAKTCFAEDDGGVVEVPLPDGIEYLSSDEWERPYVPGEPVFEVWTQEHPAAPWRCACGASGGRPDAGPCERLAPLYAKGKRVEIPEAAGGGSYEPRVQLDGGVWTPVLPHESMAAGEFRGDCYPMPCATWAGMDPRPEACRSGECLGRECGMGRAGGWCGPVQGYRTKDDAGNDLTCAANRWQRECPVCPKPRGRAEAAVKPKTKGPKGRWYVSECPPCPE